MGKTPTKNQNTSSGQGGRKGGTSRTTDTNKQKGPPKTRKTSLSSLKTKEKESAPVSQKNVSK